MLPAPPPALSDLAEARSRRARPLASVRSRIAVWGVLATALMVCTIDAGVPAVGATFAATIALGAWIAERHDLHRAFEDFNGIVYALLALVISALVLAAVDAAWHVGADNDVALVLVVLPSLLVCGMDWVVVSRLRFVTVASALLIIPTLADATVLSVAVAASWFALAALALWLLEFDVRQTIPRPIAVRTQAPGLTDHLDPVDLRRVIAAAALGAVGVLLLIAAMQQARSSSPATPPPPLDEAGQQGAPSGSGLINGSEEGWDQAGLREQQFKVDEDGYRFVTGEDGERYRAIGSAASGVVVDEDGTVIARYDEDGFAAPGDEGRGENRFQVDEDGHLVVMGRDGQRYTVEPDGDDLVFVDEDGEVVTEGWIADDHLYVRDPDGRILLPSADGDSGIPLPPEAVRRGFLGQRDGQSIGPGDLPGSVEVRSDDGTSRTYEELDDGRIRVTSTDEFDRTSTFEYEMDDRGVYTQITQIDARGERTTYVYDPAGIDVTDPFYDEPDDLPDDWAEGWPGAQDPPVTAPETTVPPGAEDGAGDRRRLSLTPWLLGLTGGLALLGAGLLLASRRRRAALEGPGAPQGTPTTGPLLGPPPPVPWAVAQVERIEGAGRARGRPRHEDETILDYTRALAGTEIPDADLVWIGEMVSRALFGPGGPDGALRADVEARLDALLERHPVAAPSDQQPSPTPS